MLAPLIAATIGIATVEAAERMMLEMLIDAAAALLATNGDQVKQANDLLRRTRRVYKEHRNDMARALLHDLERIFALNAQDEIGRGKLGSMLASTVQEQAREKARRMASDLGDEILGFGESMAMSVKNKYLQEVARACLQVDSGVRKKDKAIKEAVSRLASDGLVAKTYVTKDGRTVNVPVDVAIRRTIQDECMHRLTDQTLEIAEFSGAEYVEVSSHIGARPSHAEWHGRIYQLHGSDRFPNFYEACHVGDLVNGYGGYNCRHHIGIWTEGMPRRWSEHPEEGTGYTNEEIYELQQQQRRYENDIRKLKRQKEVLEAQGYDARDINARLKQQRAVLRKLIADNDRVLVRQEWRESEATYIRKQSGNAGRVHLGKSERQFVESTIDSQTLLVGDQEYRVSNHALDRVRERGISKADIEDALVNPLSIGDIGYNSAGQPSIRYIGERATVNVNPETNRIATCWRTGQAARRRYRVKQGGSNAAE